MRTMNKLALGATLALALLGCKQGTRQGTAQDGSGESLAIEHPLGTTILAKNPQQVVTLDYACLENLDELGIPVIGLPMSNLPKYLSHYGQQEGIANLGTLFEVDFERLNELAPQVIFISARMEKHYGELSKIAPTIYIQQDPGRWLESFEENLDVFGKLFDKGQEVDAAKARIRAKIGALEGEVTSRGSNALVVMHNKGKFSAFGRGSRFGALYQQFGFEPAVSGLDTARHGQAVSNEFILDADPDYLFIVDRSAVVDKRATNREAIENALIQRTRAYKNGNIVYLDPEAWYLSGGGITSFELMIEEVANHL